MNSPAVNAKPSVNGALQRIPSDSSLNSETAGAAVPISNKPWERSQSAFELENKDKFCYKSSSLDYTTSTSTTTTTTSGGSIAEHSKVYLDLSNPGEDESASWAGGKFKISLQTIHQKEEMKTSPSVSIQACVVRRMSSEAGGVHAVRGEHADASKPSTPPIDDSSSPQTHTKMVSVTYNQAKTTFSLDDAIPIMQQQIRRLRSSKISEQCSTLKEMLDLVKQAWAMPSVGHDVACGLCDVLRVDGGLALLIQNCDSSNHEVQLNSARLLEQTMTVTNRDVLSKSGLDIIVRLARSATKDLELTKVTTGILSHLLKHSQNTCSRVIKSGGLDTILYSCRTSDKLTLRHCAVALANLAIFGGAENQYQMIVQRVPEWLFPLAFSHDDSIRYYAFLAISMLSGNKEIETAVAQSGTLELVEPFLNERNPVEFAKSDTAHIHGQSTNWLRKLVPLMSSMRKEAQSLAAFHFAMEACIKQEQGKVEVFQEIEAVEPLKCLASSPNKLASRFATQALDIIGEEVPYRLSAQVPLWTPEDVVHWLQRTGFGNYTDTFLEYEVDGDLLLALNNTSLKDDLSMTNGITRKRFLRELNRLKWTADYQSCDHTKLYDWLHELGDDISCYSYQMLKAGAERRVIRFITEEQLQRDCGIANGIHRMKIIEAAKKMSLYMYSSLCGSDHEMKTTDCFISYRRSNGSQLASLLKVHLQVRGLTVFLDIEKLRAGKFDDNLLNSVRNARNFILVLTPSSLDRCISDSEQKDWVHREVVAALEGGCNIIPVMDNFQWPPPESLPEDMRSVCFFNGIRWIHDYQDACVDKLERFINGEQNTLSTSVTNTSLQRPPLSKANSLTTTTELAHSHDMAREVFKKTASLDLTTPPVTRSIDWKQPPKL